MPEKLSIVIPVYNEGENIQKTLAEIESKINTPHRVYIVYDFDEDNTLPAAREYMAKHRIENVEFVKNKYGKGALNAIKTGMESVDGELVLVAMGDLSDDIAVVDDMVKMAEEGYDVVCGSRYMKGGRQIGGPFLKGLFSRVAGVSLHYLSGIPTKDVTNSFKLYRRSLLDEITIESTGGFELGMEITVKAYAKGRKVGEVPSTWRDRSAGESRFRMWEWIPNYLKWYFYAIKKGRFGNRQTDKG